MNNMFGITGIKVGFFAITYGDTSYLDDFLSKHDGDIIDIQFQQNEFSTQQVMVVYKKDTTKNY